MARRRSTAKRGPGKFSPTKFGKGPMGGPTGPGRQGEPNRAAIRRNETGRSGAERL